MKTTKDLYIFDFDCNLMYVPSKVVMERYENGKWVEEHVDSEEFTHKRNRDDYRISENHENPFDHFRRDSLFISDFNEALGNYPETKGPSFDKFIRCLENGDDLCIITARGQSPEVLRSCLTNLILYSQEHLDHDVKYELVDSLNNLTIYPVSSTYFNRKFETDNDNWEVSDKKKIGFSNIVREKYKGMKEDILCVGFSDDDPRNINAIREVIDKDLKRDLKRCHFVLYDTSVPNVPEKIKVTCKEKISSSI